MSMPASAMEARRLGHHEVRIINAYTVEAGHEASGTHDPTPNWREKGPALAAAESFRLRIVAGAGRDLGNSALPYDLVIQPVCLTNPHAVEWLNLDAVVAGETFSNAAGWEDEEDGYTKSWSIHFPTAVLNDFPDGLPMHPWNQVDETYQFVVSIRDTAGDGAGNKQFGCTFETAPFRLLRP